MREKTAKASWPLVLAKEPLSCLARHKNQTFSVFEREFSTFPETSDRKRKDKKDTNDICLIRTVKMQFVQDLETNLKASLRVSEMRWVIKFLD